MIEETRFYGGNGTIHDCDHLDVEVRDGTVVAVWFRCAMLPFKQANVDKQRAAEMGRYPSKDLPAIVGLELKDR